MKTSKATLIAICAAGLLIGCGKSEAKPTPTSGATPATTAASPTPAAKADPASQAKKVFKAKCVVCHGDHGAGDGPGAAALNPKPRAFGDADWQKEATDDGIKKAIVEGGAAVGKSAGMPGNPDLRKKPEVVDELVKIVRGFKQS